jgi:hypothetical protein
MLRLRAWGASRQLPSAYFVLGNKPRVLNRGAPSTTVLPSIEEEKPTEQMIVGRKRRVSRFPCCLPTQLAAPQIDRLNLGHLVGSSRSAIQRRQYFR